MPRGDIKFVAMDPSRGGLPVKRKQTQHACSACRRKKRRCHHDEAIAEDPPEDELPHTSPSQASTAMAPSKTSPNALALKSPSALRTSETLESSFNGSQDNINGRARPEPQGGTLKARSSRFVGDLNPEGMFLEATGEASARETSQKGDVGIWLSAVAPGGSAQQPSQFITSRPPPIMDRFLLPFVKERCLACLPPEEDFVKLKAIFLQKIYPLFPVVPIAALDAEFSLENPANIVLRQLVCLAAGTDPDMSQNLRLQNHGPDVMTPQDFSQALSSAVRTILETSIITDRVLHIRALTILSLYTQPTCAEEADLPAQLGGRAIHHIQTLGLHLLRYDASNCDDLENLFCAVWAIDRINAATYGRPCLLHERDIGANLQACIKKRPPCFRLLLSIVQWLDHVVELYRPGATEGASGFEKIAYIDLPVLEGMIVDADALQVPLSLIATIETFYHAIIILSCRLPRPGTVPAATTLPPPSANARRSLAAERIACAVPRDHLSPVPFVPYAVSLALSVEYRKMRHSRLPMFRARAMRAFRRNCEMLRSFRDYFWSANVMVTLGDSVLKEMERAATTLTREVTPLPPGGDSAQLPAVRQGNQPVKQVEPFIGDPSAATDATEAMNNIADFSLFDNISGGDDIFGHIDPNFDLNTIEDVLEANLDIGLPPNWGDWTQFPT